MKDIDWFYEEDLDKTNIVEFYNSLPSRLQNMFKNSVNVGIIGGNVLQGYRGPSYMCNYGSGDTCTLEPTNGILEIRYWWGARKDLNFIPVFGTVIWATGRATQIFTDQLKWRSLYFDSKTGECLSHDENEAADKLNAKGLELFRERKYAEAAEYYCNAHRFCTSGYKNEQTFKKNRDETADKLNAKGLELFRVREYAEAAEYYGNAFRYCSCAYKNEQTFKKNRDEAKAEVQAMELCSEGDVLFDQSMYDEAFDKYREAYAKSSVSEEYNVYKHKRDTTISELDAIKLCSDGDVLFDQEKYTEAIDKYQEACNKTNVPGQLTKYRENIKKANAEVESKILISEGDVLFRQGKYTEAVDKYKKTYDKSKNRELRNNCSSLINQTERIVRELSKLDDLWNKAWDAENDTENDRSCQAEAMFQTCLDRSKDCLKDFPDVSGFKRFENLAYLKIQGNELFNRGLESQMEGNKCFKEAHELRQQLKFALARVKYLEARSKFNDAKDKFITGSKSDEKFESCIDFIQSHLDEVDQSLDIIESYALDNEQSDSNANVFNETAAAEQPSYYAHI